MAGAVSSLNVSVAGAVVMYEAMRQRNRPAQPIPSPKSAAPAKPRRGLGS
jgi:23S rRNA (guanosine2251-2'-O)-methyltransferase